MAASIKDVAAKAGLSHATVSLILNGKGDKRFPSATRERVFRAAQDMEYRPNALARSLKSGRSETIGLYNDGGFMDTSLSVFAEVMAGLEAGCVITEQDLLMHGRLRRRPATEAFAEIVNGKVDGLVLHTALEDELVERLTSVRFPLITMIDRIPGLPCVVVDVDAGGRLLAEHLSERGYHEVLYRIPGDATENIHRRMWAFQSAAAALGVMVIEMSTDNWTGQLSNEEIAAVKAAAGRGRVAVAGCTDVFADPVCDVCDALGLRIPDDVAVVGFNGIRPPMKPMRRLTTIRANWREVGERAVQLLKEIIDGHEVPTETVVPVELAIGDTT